MNKEKVMKSVYELSDLQSICDKDIRQKAIDKIEHELDSKPVMPKVFDAWFKYYKERSQDKYYMLMAFNDVITGKIPLFAGDVQLATDEDVDLAIWLWKDNSLSYSEYQDCITAIVNGYEVEK